MREVERGIKFPGSTVSSGCMIWLSEKPSRSPSPEQHIGCSAMRNAMRLHHMLPEPYLRNWSHLCHVPALHRYAQPICSIRANGTVDICHDNGEAAPAAQFAFHAYIRAHGAGWVNVRTPVILAPYTLPLRSVRSRQNIALFSSPVETNSAICSTISV